MPMSLKDLYIQMQRGGGDGWNPETYYEHANPQNMVGQQLFSRTKDGRSVIRSSDEGWITEDSYDPYRGEVSDIAPSRISPYHNGGNADGQGQEDGYSDQYGVRYNQDQYNAQGERDFQTVLNDAKAKGYTGINLVGYLDQQLRAKGLGSVTYHTIDRLINEGLVNGNDTLPSGENLYGYADRNRAIAQDKKSGGIFNNGAMFDQFMLGAGGMLLGGALGGAFGGTTTSAAAAPTATAAGAGATQVGMAGAAGGFSVPASQAAAGGLPGYLGGTANMSIPAMGVQPGAMGILPEVSPLGMAGLGGTGATGLGLNGMYQGSGGVEQGAWNPGTNTEFEGYSMPQEGSSPRPPVNTGGSDVMMQQDFGQPVNAGQGPINSNFEPSRFGNFNPRTGAPISNAGLGGGGQWGTADLANAAQAGLGLLGGIQSFASAEDMEDLMHQQMQDAQANQQPTYPYEMNWDKVNEYLRDPMSILRSNPGYLASVDFVEKEGRRKMAQQGYNASGNSTHYLADVLGKNASKWYEQSWAPIRDAAGLMSPPDPSRLAQVGVNAQSAINSAKQNATQNLFAAGTMALPSIFKFALG